jgi:hypothetical protein
MKTVLSIVCKYVGGDTLYNLHMSCKDARDVVRDDVYYKVVNGINSLFRKNMGELADELTALLRVNKAVISGSIVPMLALGENWLNDRRENFIPDIDVYLRGSIANSPTYKGYYHTTAIDELLFKKSEYWYSHHLRRNMYKGFEGIAQVRSFHTSKPMIQTIIVQDDEDLVSWIRSNFDIDILMNVVEFTETGIRLTIMHPRRLLAKLATVVGFKNIGTTVGRIFKYEERGFTVSRDDERLRASWTDQHGGRYPSYDEHAGFFSDVYDHPRATMNHDDNDDF